MGRSEWAHHAGASLGATHFKLSIAALVIDLDAPDEQELAMASTGESPIDAVSLPVDLTAAFTLDPTNKAIMMLVLIEFFQEVNGNFYTLRNGSFNALRIIGVDANE